jgi:hypothetical protein
VSTSHYTLIAGAMRMPRLRPLELVSRAVGREWALLPPNVSLRTELKALYAALMRTVCLSASAIRLMCHWDPQTLREIATPVFRPSPTPADQKNPIPLDLRHPERGAAHKQRQWNSTLAGGACAVSGAAVIAWLLASHTRNPAPPTPVAPADVTLSAQNRHNPQPTEPTQAISRADAIRDAHFRSGQVTDATRSPDAAVVSTAAPASAEPESPSVAAKPAANASASVSGKRSAQREAVRAVPASRATRQSKREKLVLAKPEVRRAPYATYSPPHIASLRAPARGCRPISGRWSQRRFIARNRVFPLPETTHRLRPLLALNRVSLATTRP